MEGFDSSLFHFRFFQMHHSSRGEILTLILLFCFSGLNMPTLILWYLGASAKAGGCKEPSGGFAQCWITQWVGYSWVYGTKQRALQGNPYDISKQVLKSSSWEKAPEFCCTSLRLFYGLVLCLFCTTSVHHTVRLSDRYTALCEWCPLELWDAAALGEGGTSIILMLMDFNPVLGL